MIDCEHLEHWLTELAGESWPVYIVLQSELGIPHAGAWGAWGGNLDLFFKPTIGPRWQGRGAAILLADTEISTTAEQAGLAQTDWAAITTRSLLLHELAHALEHVTPFTREAETRPAAAIAQSRERAIQFLADPGPAVHAALDVHHGPQFQRIGLHLEHRAAVDVDPRILLNAIGFTHWRGAGHFRNAITDELQARPGWDELRTSPVPTGLVDAWKAACGAI